MRVIVVLAVLFSSCLPVFAQERYEGPIIDMHLHARFEVTQEHRYCFPQPCVGDPTMAKSGDAIRPMTLEAMDRNNVVLGVVTDRTDRVLRWVETDAEKFMVGIRVRDPAELDLSELRVMLEFGRANIIGEVTSQYDDIPIDDPLLDPVFALAHELDVPILVHVAGLGGSSDFRSDLGNPLRLVPILGKYPGLRLYLENAGWPFLEEATALMYQYPSVHADISIILHLTPPSVALAYLKGLIDNGLSSRIMFGSDQMIWPEVIDEAVDRIQSADFLTAEQKGDILYNNAARFLRLSDDQIAMHKDQ